MSDSDLSPIEDTPILSEPEEEELDQFLEEEEEEDEEEFEDLYSEEDDFEDDYSYESSKKTTKSIKTPTKSVKIKIKPPSKSAITPSKISKPKVQPKHIIQSVKHKKAPTRPSKLSQEITQEPISSRPRRGKPHVNYNDEINDEDIMEEDELSYDLTESNNNKSVSKADMSDKNQYEANEETIPTHKSDELSDEEEEEEVESDEEEEEDIPPDLTKMTERQRAMLEEPSSIATVAGSGDEFDSDSSQISLNSHLSVLKSKNSQFLSLSNNIKKRYTLTEEENQIRRAEIARKRRNLSEKRLEEEKQDTINKLLKRRAKTTRTTKKAGGPIDELDADGDPVEGGKTKPRRPKLEHKALFRWSSKVDGLKLGIPEAFVKTS